MKITVITGREKNYRQQAKNLTNEGINLIQIKKKKKKMKKMKTQPNLVNDGSKEPQKQDEYSTSSSGKFN